MVLIYSFLFCFEISILFIYMYLYDKLIKNNNKKNFNSI